jgi:phage FluMu gp28-like protein
VKEQKKVYYIGVDLAKTVDYSVITVVKVDYDNKMIVVDCIDRFNNIDWNTQKERIKDVCSKYPNSLVVMDSTGVGSPIVDDLISCSIPTEGVRLGVKNKNEICGKLAVFFDNKQIVIPDNFELIEELRNFEISYTDFGTLRLSAPSGKHDDMVISLALACKNITF